MESLAYCVFGIIGIVACLFIASSLGLLVGLIGLLARQLKPIKDRPVLTWLFAGLATVSGVMLLIMAYGTWRVGKSTNEWALQNATLSASYTPQYFNAENEEMRPFISALNAVDRASLGFTLIPPYARVEIERTVPPATYDVMLHVYADTRRTIAFKKKGGGFVWIGEQEIHTGPNQYLSADGYFHEEIVVTYDTVYISGVPLNTVYIIYHGDDPRLGGKLNLTLQDIQPILEEWKKVQLTPTTPSQ